MAVVYAVKKVRNPKDPDNENWCTNRVQKAGDYDFKELAEDIAHATTCTEGDALAVLTSIVPFIKKALLAGKSIHLDGLGSFMISIQGKAFTSDTFGDKEFSPSSFIKGWKVVYRPDASLKKQLRDNIAYKRISSEILP